MTRSVIRRIRRHPLLVWCLLRGFWALLLVLHLPLLLSTAGFGDAPLQLSRVLVLGAACAIFALKVADLRWLRLPADRRVWLAVAVAVALLHAGAVAPELITASADALLGSLLLVLALIAGIAVRPPASVLRAAQRRALGCLRELLTRIDRAGVVFLLPPRFLRLATVHSPVRPPPQR